MGSAEQRRERKSVRKFGRKTCRKERLGRPRPRWKDNINRCLKGIRWEVKGKGKKIKFFLEQTMKNQRGSGRRVGHKVCIYGYKRAVSCSETSTNLPVEMS